MAKDRKGQRVGQSDSPPPDLNKEREQFLRNFSKGTRLTEEFVQEHERLQHRLHDLEAENARLRAKVEADGAIRELLEKIEQLEREKSELLSRFHEAEAVSSQFSERFHEVETEFADLANLFVASNQLHSSLSPRGVTRRIKEVLAQLVGAERYCMYLVSPDGGELVPIASEGVPGDRLVAVRAASAGRIGEVLRTGSAFVDEEADPSRGSFGAPAAVVPLSVDEKVVGLIVIYSTLSQKTKFDTIDFELFKLLGQHAAAALVSASLFAQAERKIPGLEAFLDLSV
jgi:GAF domain